MAKRITNPQPLPQPTQAQVTQAVTAQVRQWLRKYGNAYYDKDYGYSDCDMIDSCIHDLDLQDHRSLVNTLVDQYVNA